MADTDNAAPSEAPASDPPRAKTLRDYAREHELADWQLAQVGAVTKRSADEPIDEDAFVEAVKFLTDMTLGG
ncbi:MAG: hypothetical protein JNK05_34915 [Myxococcales bacterium]|nr:hypothetical protein [Myxococcales bacterium]